MARPLGTSSPTKTYIYGLVEPGCGQIMYVGRTTDPVSRLCAHVSETIRYGFARSPKHLWIRELLARGAKPEMVILGECHKRNAVAEEKKAIEEIAPPCNTNLVRKARS